ncbi:MAG: hypothetical protein P4M12_04590 [Gammaproteobacteria bacterium]|nr:hypothetical protein [Gammaproteobacteria bacterium]
MQQRNEIRYHKCFPTVTEATDNLRLVDDTHDERLLSYLSDHLPMLAEIPVQDKMLRVITWNVLKPNTSGFNAIESDEVIRIREMNTLTAISLMTSSYNPDLILLQEAYFPGCTDSEKDQADRKDFLDALGRHYEYKMDERGRVVIYNVNKISIEIKPAVNKEDQSSGSRDIYKEYKTNTQELLLTFKDDPSFQVAINNVHLPHRNFPQKTEDYINFLLNSHEGDVVVAGDFNSRYAPCGLQEGALLVNNVVAPKFVDSGIQGCDFVDGFFYKGADGQCHQPESIRVIDPIVMDDAPRFSSVSLDDFNEKQQYELKKYKPILGCAHENLPHKMLNDNLNVLLEKHGMHVCSTSNALNERGFAFIIKNENAELISYLKKSLEHYPEIEMKIKRDEDRFDEKEGLVFYVPKNSVVKFSETLEKFSNEQKNSSIKENNTFKKYPIAWGIAKWLIIGAVGATALFFSGGLAAIPFVAGLGAVAIAAATPVVAAGLSFLWNCIVKPVAKYIRKKCFSSAEDEAPVCVVPPVLEQNGMQQGASTQVSAAPGRKVEFPSPHSALHNNSVFSASQNGQQAANDQPQIRQESGNRLG